MMYETWKVAINPNDEWLRVEMVGAVVVRVWCARLQITLHMLFNNYMVTIIYACGLVAAM